MDLRMELADLPAHVGLGAATPAPQVSPTALQVDRWGMRRASDIADTWKALGVERDHHVIADAHEALFSPRPIPAELPADAPRAGWFAQLMDTPDYRALHAQTMLDPALSEIAAASICDQWAQFAATRPPEPSADESVHSTVSRIRSTQQALKAARADVQGAQDAMAGLGIGEGDSLAHDKIVTYFRRVKDDRRLREIMQWAGRMIALARALQRSKTSHGMDDTVGVAPGGDVARLIPSELAQLSCGIPEVEMLALHRIATRQALCREYRGTPPTGKGPIIVSVDESGSMSGDKIAAAKGFACAMAWIAAHQKRHVVLAAFASGARARFYSAPPGRADQDALIAWLEAFMGGGTTLDAPLGTVPATYASLGMPAGRVDHIIITDGEMGLDHDLRESYLAWARQADVHTYAVAVATSSAGPLAEVCERAWCIPSLDLDSVAVQSLFSI